MIGGTGMRASVVPALKKAFQDVFAAQEKINLQRQRMQFSGAQGKELKAEQTELKALERGLGTATNAYKKLSEARGSYLTAGRNIARLNRIQTLDAAAEARSQSAASRQLNLSLQRGIREEALQRQNFQRVFLRSGMLVPSAQSRAGFMRMDTMQGAPPVIPTGMAGILQKLRTGIQAQGGANPLLTTLAGYFGGGRAGGLGGAIGGLAGMAGWGAAIGTAIGAIIGAMRRLFDFIRGGFMDLIQFSTQLQNMKTMIGLSFKTGTQASRAAEMAGIAPEAMAIWFSRFQANIGVVEKTSPKVSNALTLLGLSLGQIRQMKPDDLFKETLDRMASMKNINDQNAVAMALFNRQGTQMRKELLNWALAAEQVGDLGAKLDKVAWTDNRGNMVRYADALSYFDKTISGLKWKKRGFIEGLTESMSPELTVASKIVNKIPAGTFGRLAGDALKGIEDHILPGLSNIFPALAKMVNVPTAPEAGTAGTMGPLSSLFAPFGKGPGDQWSKVGAFSAPGMKEGFATGIQGWREKMLSKTVEVARNTAAFAVKAGRAASPGEVIPKVIPNVPPGPKTLAQHIAMPFHAMSAALSAAGRKTAPSGDRASTYSLARGELNSNIIRQKFSETGLPHGRTFTSKLEGIMQKIHDKLPGETNVDVNLPGASPAWTY